MCHRPLAEKMEIQVFLLLIVNDDIIKCVVCWCEESSAEEYQVGAGLSQTLKLKSREGCLSSNFSGVCHELLVSNCKAFRGEVLCLGTATLLTEAVAQRGRHQTKHF